MAFSSQSFTAPSIKKFNRRTISSPLSSSVSKISGVTPTLKKSKIKFRSQGISSPITASQSSIENTLVETNTILVEIQKQLSLDFAMRIAEEKERNKVLKSDKSRRRLALKEGAIESTRRIGNIVKSATSKILAPVKSAFDKIMQFLSIIGTGIATNAVFEWLKDDENKQKLQGWFNFIVEHWKWGLTALGAVAALNLVGTISGFVIAIKGLSVVLLPAISLLTKALLIVGTGVLAVNASKAGANAIRGTITGGQGFNEAHDILDSKLSESGLGIEKTFFGMGPERGYVLPTEENNFKGSFDLTPEQQAIVNDVIKKRKKLYKMKEEMEKEMENETNKLKPSGWQGSAKDGTNTYINNRDKIRDDINKKYNQRILDTLIPGYGNPQPRAMGGL